MIIGFGTVGGGGGGVTLVSIAITPDSPGPSPGDPVQLTATGTYSDASTLNITSAVTWASADTDVATVTNGSTGGNLSAVATGSSAITATLGTASGSTTATVATIVSRGGMPLCNSATAGSKATYIKPFFVPSDVNEVTVRIANRRFDGGGSTEAITTDIAIGTSNGAGGFIGSPTVYTAQVIPGDGSILTLPTTSVVRGSDGKILIAYYVAAGAVVSFAAQTYHGWYVLNSNSVNPLGSPLTQNPSPAFWNHVEYATARRRFVVLGDSISVGCTSSNPLSVGFEVASWYLIGTENDYSVSVEGLPGGTLAEFANPGGYPYLWDEPLVANSEIAIELGVNDLNGGASAMQANLTTIVNRLRSLGAGAIRANTIAPQVSYPGTEVARLAYNSWLMANNLLLDGICDLAAQQNVGGLASNSDASVLHAAYSSDGTHLSTAGQAAAKVAWELII